MSETASRREPLDGAELLLRCWQIDSIAHAAISEDLLAMMSVVAKEAHCYHFKGRFKGAGAIQTKVRRKRLEGQAALAQFESARATAGMDLSDGLKQLRAKAEALLAYEPDHITDGYGCRFVTLYQSDIPVVIARLLGEIESFNLRHDAPPVRMVECVIYTNRPKEDPLSITDEVMAVLARMKVAESVIVDDTLIRPPETRKSAYSSVHFVFEKDVEITFPGCDLSLETGSFEVQVRDIFEEGWGEVQHHLMYSEKDDIVEGGASPGEAALWQSHLNALKTFVDGCSQHASIIKRHADAARAPSASSSAVQSITSRKADQKALVTVLNQHGADRRAVQAVSKAYTLMIGAEPDQDTGQAAVESDYASQRKFYREAASEFAVARRLLTKRHLGLNPFKGEPATVQYLLDMDAAHAIFLGAEFQRGDDGAADPDWDNLTRVGLWSEAGRRYALVADEFPDDPTAKFRLAKARERLASNEAELRTVAELLDACITRIDADPSTGPDHFLPISARIDKSYVAWRMAQSATPERRANLLEEAADHSIAAFDYWRGQSEAVRARSSNSLAAHRALSNVLYFLATLLRQGHATRFGRADLEGYLAQFEALRDLRQPRQVFRTRDNLMQAMLALGRDREAEDLASTTFIELRAMAERRAGRPLDVAGVVAYLEGSERSCFESARDVLFAGDGRNPVAGGNPGL